MRSTFLLGNLLVMHPIMTWAAPEISMFGNGQFIGDGDGSPSLADGTDFGTATVGSPVNKTYIITNVGSSSLTISVPVSNPGNGFTIIGQPATNVAPASSTTITVQFIAPFGGPFSQWLSIGNNDSDENPYNFAIMGFANTNSGTNNAAEINVTGNGLTIVDGDVLPSVSDGTDFGTVSIGSSVSKTYNIQNFGAAPLTINTPVANPGNGFSVTAQPANNVPVGGSTTITVQFAPVIGGSFNATLNIGNNDSNENPYNFAISGFASTNGGTNGVAPEINVVGNGQSIIDGDVTPSTLDHTDFGTVSIGSSVNKTYTIQNLGTAPLTINTPVNNPGNGFTIVSQPANSVAVGGSTTITVKFTPVFGGLFNATLNIGNNDSNENPYNFAIKGFATTNIATNSAPEINVVGNGQSIIDGDITPTTIDHTDFGTVAVGSSANRTYTIQNFGTAPLTINTPVNNPGNGFTIVSQPANSIAPGSSTTITVKFAPVISGTFNTTLNIGNNDSNENPYNFSLRGTGTTNTISTNTIPIVRFDTRLQRYILWIPPCDITPAGWNVQIAAGYSLGVYSISTDECALPIKRILQRPAHGILRIKNRNQLLYVPKKGYIGRDRIVFAVKSESGSIQQHELTVEIQNNLTR